MDINDHSNKNRGYLKLAIVRESATIAFGRDSKVNREGGESFIVKKRVGFTYVLIGGCWYGKLEAG